MNFSSRSRRFRRSPIARVVSCLTASALGFGVLAAVPNVAHAQDANCPPGSWFCAEAPPATTPPATAQPTAPTAPAAPSTQPAPPPPVVVYQPPPPVVVVSPREAPQVYHYTPRPKSHIPHREWGLNLHLAGIAMGSGRSGEAGMGLIGLGLRFRPVPGFALEANIDVAGGTDYNGFRRTETMGTMNALVFLNPKSRAQFYLLGGLGMSSARVSGSSGAWETDMYGGYYGYADRKYTYFGGQGGAGIEIRLSRVVALNFDVRGFVRSRVDGRGAPEFIDSSGRTTNTSGGALVNGGITFYF